MESAWECFEGTVPMKDSFIFLFSKLLEYNTPSYQSKHSLSKWDLYSVILTHKQEKFSQSALTDYESLLWHCHELYRNRKFEESTKLNKCTRKLKSLGLFDDSGKHSFVRFLLLLKEMGGAKDRVSLLAPSSFLAAAGAEDTPDIPLLYNEVRLLPASAHWHYTHFPSTIFEASPSTLTPPMGDIWGTDALSICNREPGTNVGRLCPKQSLSDGCFGALFRSADFKAPITPSTVLSIPALSSSARLSHCHSARNPGEQASLRAVGEETAAVDEGYASSSCSLNDKSLGNEGEDEVWESLVHSVCDPKKRYTWQFPGQLELPKEKPFLTEASNESVERLWLIEQQLLTTFDSCLRPRPPREVEMKTLCQDVMTLLAGLPSNTFPLNQSTGSFSLSEGVRCKGFTPQSLLRHTEQFISSGCQVLRIERFARCTTTNTCEGGLAAASFKKAVLAFIFRHRRELHRLNSESQLWTLTQKVAPLARKVSFVFDLILECEGVINLDVFHLIRLVKSKMCFVAEKSILFLANSFFVAVAKPLLLFLESWIYEGKLMDPKGEFFISSKPVMNFDREYWTDGFTLSGSFTEDAPTFLRHLLKEAFLVGKAVNLLSVCCTENSWFARRHRRWHPAITPCLTKSHVDSTRSTCRSYSIRVQDVLESHQVSLREMDERVRIDKENLIRLSSQRHQEFLQSFQERRKRQECDKMERQKALFNNLKQAQEEGEWAKKATAEKEAVFDQKLLLQHEIVSEMRSLEQNRQINALVDEYEDQMRNLDVEQHYTESLVERMKVFSNITDHQNPLRPKSSGKDLNAHTDDASSFDEVRTCLDNRLPLASVNNALLPCQDVFNTTAVGGTLIADSSSNGPEFQSVPTEVYEINGNNRLLPLPDNGDPNGNLMDLTRNTTNFREDRENLNVTSSPRELNNRETNLISANINNNTIINEGNYQATYSNDYEEDDVRSKNRKNKGEPNLNDFLERESPRNLHRISPLLADVERIATNRGESRVAATTDEVIRENALDFGSTVEVNSLEDVENASVDRQRVEMLRGPQQLTTEGPSENVVMRRSKSEFSSLNEQRQCGVPRGLEDRFSLCDQKEVPILRDHVGGELLKRRGRNAFGHISDSVIQNFMGKYEEDGNEKVFGRPCSLFEELEVRQQIEGTFITPAAACSYSLTPIPVLSTDFECPLVIQRRKCNEEINECSTFADERMKSVSSALSQSVFGDTNEEQELRFSPMYLKEGLFEHLRIQSCLVNRALLSHFLVERNLLEHLCVIKTFILLCDATFARCLTRRVFQKFPSGCHSLSHLHSAELTAVLEDSILASPFKSPLTSNLSFYFSADLGEQISSNILNVVELRYRASWPLNVILDGTSSDGYAELFKFLVLLHRALSAVEDTFALLQSIKNTNFVDDRRGFQDLQKVLVFRFELEHFCRVIFVYVYYEAIEGCWVELQRDLRSKVHSLDQLYECHSAYIRRVTEKCFLSPKYSSIQRMIQDLCGDVLAFHDLVRLHPWGESQKEDKMAGRTFSEIRRVAENFKRTSAVLNRSLEKLFLFSQFAHVENLLLQLNFNHSFTISDYNGIASQSTT